MRYFIEVAYHGSGYAGFQMQENAVTIQYELEKALKVLTRQSFTLTGSSRTDAGVHARQNYFHFDTDIEITKKQAYNLNAILPKGVSVQSLQVLPENAHCRFDAIGRLYKFYIYRVKNPFYHDRAWFYPYPLDVEVLNNVAGLLLGTHDFTSFSKRNTQVKTMNCTLAQSEWAFDGDILVYTVQGNRFLRGMVRGLVATMLRAGRGVATVQEFAQILAARDCSKADFSAPGHGLFLEKVIFPDGYFSEKLNC
jgi:tRNA pseudouridine38-40 synthase